MKLEDMSEYEDASDGENWCHLPFTCRTDELTEFFR